jgi:outer membrane protein assembly factor BamB
LTHVTVSGDCSDMILPLPAPGSLELVGSNPQFEIVLGENNLAYVTDTTNLIAFDYSSGQTFWSYSAPNGHTVDIVAASSGGGVTINDSQQGLVPLDAPLAHRVRPPASLFWLSLLGP